MSILVKLQTPIVVRLVGTNADIAEKIIDESKVSVISAEHLEKAVQLAQGQK